VALATVRLDAFDSLDSKVRSVRLETAASAGAEAVVRRVLSAARELVAATVAVNGGDLAAVGVSSLGVVLGDQVLLAPNVPGWEGLPLPRLLGEEFGDTRTHIDNDVNAATAAELRWGRLKGVDVGVYLNLGTGLGAGLVAGGRVIPGAHGCAGEIGYLLRTPGEAGYAAGRAPLEEHVSGAALAERGSALLGEPVTAAQLFARRRDRRVRALLTESLDALAMAVANVCITIDPQRLVLGGGMVGAARAIVPRVRSAVRRTVPFPPQVTTARFIDEAPLYGALALALDAASGSTRRLARVATAARPPT
jgi:glucokinase